jgi:putative transposase
VSWIAWPPNADMRQRAGAGLCGNGRLVGHPGWTVLHPGEPWRNGYIESFNSRIRDECLNINVFWSLAQARVVISDWKRQCNWDRPHSALGYQSPARYAVTCTH